MIQSNSNQVHSAYCVNMPLTIYTVASDGRISDLAVLAESISKFDCYKLHVIPFDNSDMNLTKQLCDIYGAKVEKTSANWDELGKFFFADKDHMERGKGIKAWRYFRKLNAISLSKDSDFCFIDANSVLMLDASKLGDIFKSCDIVFGHRSATNRNFSAWAKFIINQFQPNIGEGFGAGFWLCRSGAIKEDIFRKIVLYPEIRSMLSIAPEQSILNLAIALSNKKPKLLREVSDISYCIIGRNPLEIYSEADGYFRRSNQGKDAKIFTTKWTGDYHSGRQPFCNADIHLPFAKKALEKVRHNHKLHEKLFDRFISVYKHGKESLLN